MAEILPPLLPLTLNRKFMNDFLDAPEPCFALGLVEEGPRQYGFVALRPGEAVPRKVTVGGFNFGHSLLGTKNFEVLHLAFEFYGFRTYNALVNPNNHLVRRVLATMMASGNYFFFLLDSDESLTAFRTEIGHDFMAGFTNNLPRIERSSTTPDQYRKAVAQFRVNPQPSGRLLTWVCRDDPSYLDLTHDRMQLTPS